MWVVNQLHGDALLYERLWEAFHAVTRIELT